MIARTTARAEAAPTSRLLRASATASA